MKEKDHDHILFWIKIISVVASIIIFCFTTFATKDEIRENFGKRLDRFEDKLDAVILNK